MLTVYGIETLSNKVYVYAFLGCNSAYRLRYWNFFNQCMFAPEKFVATVLTVYGIETAKNYGYEFFLLRCNSAYRLRYWNSNIPLTGRLEMLALQQCLPFTVLKLTSNTTSTCTTISSCNSAYRLRYWNTPSGTTISKPLNSVATALTVYGMRRRVRGSREAKRQWGPHISSTWTKWR